MGSTRHKVIRSVDEIPRFKTEAEEDAFWSTHRMSKELLAQGKPPPERVMRILGPLREVRRREEDEARRKHAAG